MLAPLRAEYLPPIVCGIDERYAPACSALMSSIAQAHPSAALADLRMIVLHQNLDMAILRRLSRRAWELGLSFEARECKTIEAGLPVSGWVSEAVYLRLLMPEVLTDEPTALYLDVDTLVLGDLRPLLTLPLQGSVLAAVRDAQNPVVGNGVALPGYQIIGVPYGREYFNSGVMLVGLEACRKLGVFERAKTFLMDHPDQVRFWDQDALNVAVDDGWLRLDRRWNSFAMSSLTRLPGFFHTSAEPFMPLADLLADEYAASVLHFAGPVKPWTDEYPDVPLRRLYRRYLPQDSPS